MKMVNFWHPAWWSGRPTSEQGAKNGCFWDVLQKAKTFELAVNL